MITSATLIRRALTAATLALVSVSASVMAVSADTVTGTQLPGFYCAQAPFEGQLTVCIKGDIQFQSVGSATGDVVATCEAVTEGVVSSTGVGCEIDPLALPPGNGIAYAPSLFVPGNASVTTTGVVTGVTLAAYKVCVGGDYVATDGLRGGGGTDWAVRACFTTIV